MATPAAGSLLDVGALTVEYRASASGASHTAVDGLSFTLHDGEIVGLVGSSGCGKTSTALAILGLLKTSRVVGSIRLRGRELIGLADADLRRIRGAELAIIFQEPELALNPVLRAGRQVAEVWRAHNPGGRRAAGAQALERLRDVGFGSDAPRIAASYPHQLSGGQRQRVLLAQAIACRPALVIADEPWSALDTVAQAEVLALIRDLNHRFGTAFLIISHDLPLLAAVAHRVLVMAGGRLVDGAISTALPHHIERPGSMPARALPNDAPAVLRIRDLHKTYAHPPSRNASAFAEATADRRSLGGGGRASHVGATRRVTALAGVTLAVDRGRTLAVVGRSGSGKSTLARCITGLERPDEGEVWFDGQEIAGLPERQLRRHRPKMQLILQDPAAALNPRFTAAEIVEEPLVVQRIGTRAVRRARALQLLDRVGLPSSHARRLPREFSGGERQRLAIARALALGPTLLVLDEAFSGLDHDTRGEVIDLLRALQRAHDLSYVCIAHDFALVREIADEVAVLAEGRIVERGTPANLLADPQHPATRALVAAAFAVRAAS